MVLGTDFLATPWLPRRLRLLHEACVAFQGYMTEMYEEEKRAVAERRTSSSSASSDRNLINSMVRASQDLSADGTSGMTEKEIYGSIFVFNFAGHDTTAHTFTFAIYLLAGSHPADAASRTGSLAMDQVGE